MKLLLAIEADVNVSDYNWRTPLVRAAMRGSCACVTLLLGKGSNVNVSDSFGCTPLIYAANKGCSKCVKLLLTKGAYVNVTNNDGDMPLISAAKNDSYECVKLLLDKGADVNISYNYGDTPLIYAAKKGSNECLKALLAAGANANAGDRQGKTPLIWVVSHGSQENVNALVAAGADVNWKDKAGNSVFYALSGSHRNYLQMTGFRLPDTIYLALKIKQDGIVALLIEAGADVNDCFECIRHKHGLNHPLIDLTKERVLFAEYEKITSQMKCIKLLLKLGVHVNKRSRGHTAFMKYCNQNRHPDEIFIKLLYATGQVVEWPELEYCAGRRVVVPEWLQDAEAVRKRKKCASLRDMCRVSIRTRFLNLDRHTNLFIRVPKLGLPSLLTRYLLYHMTLDVLYTEEDTDNDNNS